MALEAMLGRSFPFSNPVEKPCEPSHYPLRHSDLDCQETFNQPQREAMFDTLKKIGLPILSRLNFEESDVKLQVQFGDWCTRSGRLADCTVKNAVDFWKLKKLYAPHLATVCLANYEASPTEACCERSFSHQVYCHLLFSFPSGLALQ